MLAAERLTIQGVVQGVGFRPFVARLAADLALRGSVANTSEGVVIDVGGDEMALQHFRRKLETEHPRHARITALTTEPIAPVERPGFHVTSSLSGAGTVGALALADLAPCEACRRELFDPTSRRFRYPFISCTDCGPRDSIVATLPWDRSKTAMVAFPPCRACHEESLDLSSRYFHAETIACPECGPQIWSTRNRSLDPACKGEDALSTALGVLTGGGIVAVKGVSAWHLVTPADDQDAVVRLRKRKHRNRQPFAVLVASVTEARRFCIISTDEQTLLESPAGPIVLLDRLQSDGLIADAVAMDVPRLGVMLAPSPLHLLLSMDFGRPLVVTSANRSGMPTLYRDDAALAQLEGIADLWLGHDRPILNPADDSVVQQAAGRSMVLRRGRGLAPLPVFFPWPIPPLTAAGGQLKSTVAASRGDIAFISGHIGDLDHPDSEDRFRAALNNVEAASSGSPSALVHDDHPDYASTAIALELGQERGIPTVSVQHHLAHVAACMAEHGVEGPVLGVVWDGAGLGPDGSIWGGEFLRVEGNECRRIGRIRPFPLVGGDRAAREPWRVAVSLLSEATDLEVDEIARQVSPGTVTGDERKRATDVARLARPGDRIPATSSAGRLVDGVSALLGFRRINDYEADAALAIEAAADRAGSDCYLPIDVSRNQDSGLLEIDWRPTVRALVARRHEGVDAGELAAGFHLALIDGLVAALLRMELLPILLTGGCFQSRRLLESAVSAIGEIGRDVYWPSLLPPNDGGLSYGQLWWVGRNQQLSGVDHVPGDTR